MRDWFEGSTIVDLTDGYSLSQADSTDWGVYYSVYYNMAYNGFFKDQGLKMNHWRRKLWIHKGPAKIGGVVMAPNVIFGLFFIPPFNDGLKVVQLLKKALLNGSDRTKAIQAYEILPDQIDLFSKAGFWPGEFRCRWMQRPTEAITPVWDEHLRIASPEFCTMNDEVSLRNAEEISELSYFSYSGTLAGERRQWTTRDFFAAWTKQFAQESNEILRIASSLVHDIARDRLIGVCLVSLQDEMPAIFNIAVHLPIGERGLQPRCFKGR